MRASSVAVSAVLAFALTACAQPPAPKNPEPSVEPTPTAAAMKVCLAEDEAGSQLSGDLTVLSDSLGVEASGTPIASPDEYATALQTMVDQGCQVIVGVGNGIVDAIGAAAKANPEVIFGLIDAVPRSDSTNLRPVVFSVHQIAFVAGYLAAAESKSDVVGTFGALDIPDVTIYMDGFVQGVAYWNEHHPDKQVKVVGWDDKAREGVFVQSPKSAFEDADAGAAAAAKLVEEGADVIMPVAGASGLGAVQLAADKGLHIVWAGDDGCKVYSEYCPQMLTSVMKNPHAAFAKLVEDSQKGTTSGVIYADASNSGVLLGPVNPDVSTDRVNELAQLTEHIADGSITVTSASAVG